MKSGTIFLLPNLAYFIPLIRCSVIPNDSTGVSSSNFSQTPSISATYTTPLTVQATTKSSALTLSLKPVNGVIDVKPSLSTDEDDQPLISDPSFNAQITSGGGSSIPARETDPSASTTTVPSNTLFKLFTPAPTETLTPKLLPITITTGPLGLFSQPSESPSTLTPDALSLALQSAALQLASFGEGEAPVTKQSIEVKVSLAPEESISCCDGPIFRTLTGDELPRSSGGGSEAGGFRIVGGETGVDNAGEVTTTRSLRLFTPTTTVVNVPGNTAEVPPPDETSTEQLSVEPITTNQPATEPVLEPVPTTTIISNTETTNPPEDTQPTPANPIEQPPPGAVFTLPASDQQSQPTTNLPEAPKETTRTISPDRGGLKTVIITQLVTIVTQPAITIIQPTDSSNSVILVDGVPFTLVEGGGTTVVSPRLSTILPQLQDVLDSKIPTATKILVLTDATTTRTILISEPPSQLSRPTGAGIVVGEQTLTPGGVVTVSGQILSLASEGGGVVVDGSRTVVFETLKEALKSSASVTVASEVPDVGGSIETDRVKNPVESASGGALLPDVEGGAVDSKRPTVWKSAMLVLVGVGISNWV